MTVASPEAPRRNPEHSPRPDLAINDAIEATMTRFRGMEMPAMDHLDELTELFAENDTVILIANTGSGKTLAGSLGALRGATIADPSAKVIVTEPTRLAVERLDDTFSETMGNKVGFRHGGKNNTTSDTQLEFAVAASALNTITRDNPNLLGYSGIVIDEAHIRNIDTDIVMGLIKKIQENRRTLNIPLKLLVTSATIDKAKFLEYFPDSKLLEIPGSIKEITDNYSDVKIEERDMPYAAARKVKEVVDKGDEEPGDILIFMPGQGEIESTIAAIKLVPELKAAIEAGKIEVESIMGGEHSSENAAKLGPSKEGIRRIFVSTNAAETSVTVPGIRVVIDSGLMRQNVFDPETGISNLETGPHTRSNALQRRGRAGRTDTGTVHFLFTKEDYDSRPEFLAPEILRIDLAAQILKMKKMGIPDIIGFDFMDHPGKEKIEKAMDSLRRLGALNPDGTLTEIGNEMSEINAEPHLARMIVEAKKLGCEETVALVAGLIQNSRYDTFSTKDGRPPISQNPKYQRFIDPTSDIITRLRVWNEYVKHNRDDESRKAWEAENDLRTYGFYLASGARKEILGKRSLKDVPVDLSPEMIDKITQAVAIGLPGNLLTRAGATFNASGGIKNVSVDRGSVLTGTNVDNFISANIRSFNNRVNAGLNFIVSPEIQNRIREIYNSVPRTEGATSTTTGSISQPSVPPGQIHPNVTPPIEKAEIHLPHFHPKEPKKKKGPADKVAGAITKVIHLPIDLIKKLPYAHDTELFLKEVIKVFHDPKDEWKSGGGHH